MKKLSGRVVVVTGASSGIGWETALAFAREKCKVAVCARRENRLRELCDLIRQAGGEPFAVPVDVAVRSTVHDFIQQVLERWGRVDVVVANAGYGYLASVNEIDPVQMERIWQVNFMGSFHAIQASLPGMLAQKEGHIAIVSSVVGRYPLPVMSAYCATKFAQVALGQSLRMELRPHNIGVTMVYPGFTATEFRQNQLNTEKRPDLGRKSQPASEVASAILSAVRKNRKEMYPNFTGSLFAHFGLWFPSFMDEAVGWITRRMKRA